MRISRRSRQYSPTSLRDNSIWCTAWAIWWVLFVNVGSVGKPKDGDRRACYAILDTLAPAAEFVRVEYDVPRVTAAIRASELPPEFAAELETASAAQTPSR